jgi:VWFA-related protein
VNDTRAGRERGGEQPTPTASHRRLRAGVPWAVPIALLVWSGSGMARSASESEPLPQSAPPAATAPAAVAEQTAPRTPAFPARIDLVTVDVVAVDKAGRAVAGLGQGDFTVLEDGVPQVVTSFQPVVLPATPEPRPASAAARPRVSSNEGPEPPPGRTFVMCFDDIHLSQGLAVAAKAAIGEFLRTGVREGDRVGLVAASGATWWSALMPEGRETLVAILKRLDGRFQPEASPDRVTAYEAMRIVEYDDPDVGYQVQRRFDAYGTNRREQSGDRLYRDTLDRTSVVGLIDPYVRGRAVDVHRQATERRKITMRTMTRAIQALAGVKGRKAMLLVSGGFIYEPNFRDMKLLVDASTRANVPIHFIDSAGLKALPDFMTAEYANSFDIQDTVAVLADITREAEGAENAALDTGGIVVKNTNDLASGIGRVSAESLAYYLLGYTPANTARDGKFRRINVKLAPARAKGLKLRARRGYFAPEDRGETLARKGSDPEIGRALDSPLERRELPLRVSAWSFDEATPSRLNVMLTAEIGVGELQLVERDGRMAGDLAFLIEAQNRDSGEYFGVDEKIEVALLPESYKRLRLTGHPVSREFELPPGSYQAKVVVRELGSGRIGSVIHDFDVPGVASFRVSTPVLSDALEERAPGATTAARPVLSVRRRFAQGSTLYVQYSVLGAAKDAATRLPRVSAGYEIRRPDGSILKSAPPTTINPTSIGSLLRLHGLQLGEAPPGAYELVLRVKDELGGQQLEVHEPFEIGAS